MREFKSVTDPKDIDPEAFYRLVLTVRSVAVARPYNLTKFPDSLPAEPKAAGMSTMDRIKFKFVFLILLQKMNRAVQPVLEKSVNRN